MDAKGSVKRPEKKTKSPAIIDRTLFLEAVNRCARCGKCRTVCPVFLETGHEAFVARGRITLLEAILKGTLKPGKETRRIFQSCLKCLKCVEACPAGVDFSALFLKMQSSVCTPLSLGLPARLFFNSVLPRRRLMNVLVWCFSAIQSFLPRKGQGGLRHIPLLFKGKKRLPALARKSALKSLPLRSGPKKPKARVALFLGCLINYCYPGIAASLIRVLNRLQIEVVIPGKQVCCGAPLQYYGYTKGILRLAKKNSLLLREIGADAVVTACATCTRSLRTDIPKLLGKDGEWLGEHVFDIHEYITTFHLEEWEKVVEENAKGAKKLPLVTYHDPCHLLAGAGIRIPPRTLLNSASRFCEAQGKETCCGGGGLFSIYYPFLSGVIGKKRVSHLLETGAELIATGCPGCRMQIEEMLLDAGRSVEVMHTMEVISRFLQKSEE